MIEIRDIYWVPICFAVFLLISHSVQSLDTVKQDTLKIVIPPLEPSAKNHSAFFPKLLDLVLDKTSDEFGSFRIDFYSKLFTNGRFLTELKHGNIINVMWTMTSPKRETELLPIPISLLKGLNSHRVFLILQNRQDQFHRVKTLDDLRQYKAGVGVHWPNRGILERNGIPTVTSTHYELLFDMLKSRRFDYYPRGLYEVWDEQKVHAADGVVVEDSIMLKYHAPIYFFVNRRDTALAHRIELGLKRAMEDGSFDALFNSIPGFSRGLRELQNNNRRIFKLRVEENGEN